jgi:CBS domain-containing protein
MLCRCPRLGPRHIAQAHRFDPRGDQEIPVRDLGSASWIALRPDDDLDAIPVPDAERYVLGLVTAHDIARAVADVPGCAHPHWDE